MTLQERQEKMKVIFDEVLALTQVKVADYSPPDDSFKAMQAVERVGLHSTEEGILGRVYEKLDRIINMLKSGKAPEVKDEPTSQTLRDCIGHLALLIIWIEQPKGFNLNARLRTCDEHEWGTIDRAFQPCAPTKL